jgi:LCP family protein required for cell wall assembly
MAASRAKKAALISGRVVVALLSAAVLTGTAYGWATFQRVDRSVNKTDVLVQPGDPLEEELPPPPPADDGATDILLVGSDSRTDAQGVPLPDEVLRQLRTEASVGLNTDTIILVRIPHDGGRAYAVSVPRDTYVPIPGLPDDKINGAYGLTKAATWQQLRAEGVTDAAERERRSDQAGRRVLVQVVQDLTGVRVDHYAEINLYGFYLLTQVVGGVEVCLNRATSDPDSGADFAAGVQRVSGGDALAFVRQRKNLPDGDLSRIARQQAFMSAAVSQLFSAGNLVDQDKLNGLLEAVNRSVVVDETLNTTVLLQQVQGLAGGNVEFATIPVVNVNATSERGQSIVQVDREQVRSFVARLLGTTAPATPGPTQRFGSGKVVALDGARSVAVRQAVRCVD